MNPSQKTAVITLLAIFGLATAGNVTLTLYYLWWFDPRFDYFAALGLLVAQPCLLSIWCALGGQKAIVRIAASMGMLLILSIVYISLLASDSGPAEVLLILVGIVIAISAIIQIPLWIFRATTRQVIVLPSETESPYGASQFGIKHLLISTTIAAIVVAVGRANFHRVEFQSSPAPWISICFFSVFFIIVASVLTFLILAVVFNRNHRRVFIALLIAILLAAPFASLELFRNSVFSRGRRPWRFEEFLNAFGFTGGLASGILIVLFIFYSIGFRLKKLSS